MVELPPTIEAPKSERRRPKVDRGLMIASGVIALGLVLIIWGFFTAQTGSDGIDRPDAIEAISPVENALQVFQQESVLVDFEFGYEARFVIDGIELTTTRLGELEADIEPGTQVSIPPTAVFDAGNSILRFTPSEGAAIESFSEGRHTVTVIYWRIEDGPEQARSYTWSFNVI